MRAPGGTSAIWSIISQGANSVSNIALGIAVAKISNADTFGRWSLAYLVFIVVYSCLRALASTPLLLARDEEDARSLSAGATALGAVGGAASALLAVPLLLVNDAFRAYLPAFLALLIFLAPIDSVRAAALRLGRNHIAAMVDVLWLAGQLALFLYVLRQDQATPNSLTVAWGAVGIAAGLAGVAILRTWPTISGLRRMWILARPDTLPLVLDQALMSLRAQATPFVLAVTAGYAATAALRAGLTLMGAVNAFVLGVTPWATLMASRGIRAGASASRMLNRWSIAILVAGALNGALLLLLPDHLGRALMGENWASATTVLFPLVLHSMLRGPVSGVPIVLKARGHMKTMLGLRARVEPVALVVPVLGAILWDAPGAAWGLVVSVALTNVQSYAALRRSLRLPAREQSTA